MEEVSFCWRKATWRTVGYPQWQLRLLSILYSALQLFCKNAGYLEFLGHFSVPELYGSEVLLVLRTAASNRESKIYKQAYLLYLKEICHGLKVSHKKGRWICFESVMISNCKGIVLPMKLSTCYTKDCYFR